MRYLLSFSLLIAACSTPSPTSYHQSKLVNGTSDSEHLAVGELAYGNEGHCTGTLIAPDRVLTAAHCVMSSGWPKFYLRHLVFIGPTGERHRVERSVAHPLWHAIGMADGSQGDVAVVELEAPLTDVTPMGLAQVAPQTGEAITLVGFGLTAEGADDSGSRRQAPSEIVAVGDDSLEFDGQGGLSATICRGDSGGPTLARRGADGAEVLVGVHSRSDQGCQGRGIDMRVDVYRGWIESYTFAGPYGMECATNADCISNRCVRGDHGEKTFCSRACSTDSPCPQDDSCTSEQVCRPFSAPKRALGESCDSSYRCVGELCVATKTGAICSEECSWFPCPDGFRCGGYCFPEWMWDDAGVAGTDGSPDAGVDPGKADWAPPDAPEPRGCALGGEGSHLPSSLWSLLLLLLFGRKRQAGSRAEAGMHQP